MNLFSSEVSVTRSSRMFFYKPYLPLSSEDGDLPGDAQLSVIADLMRRGLWEGSLSESRRLIDDALEGLRYLQTCVCSWLVVK